MPRHDERHHRAAWRSAAALGLGAALMLIAMPAHGRGLGGATPGAHLMPFVDPSAPAPAAAAATPPPHLAYFGGPVISRVQIVQVLYGGAPTDYQPYVSSTSTPSLATMYGGAPDSPYFDWLVEYDTPQSGGTGQTIGRGGFLVQKVITPSAANDGATISDAQIVDELAAQLQAGALPAPTNDSAGNANTVYMVHFPQGKTITLDSASSCTTGGFCAYHSSFGLGAQNVYYGVLPDMGPQSACHTGCGQNAVPFGNQTSVASHELVEAVTDPIVSLGWFDPNTGNEIGDICNQQQGTVVGGDGVTYVVQKEFSNQANACIVTAPAATPALGAYAPALALGLLLGGRRLGRRATAARTTASGQGTGSWNETA